MFQPNYNEIELSKTKSATASAVVESKLDLSDVKKPLSVLASVFAVGQEQKEEGTTIGGKVVFTIVYLTEEGFKKSESSVDVSLVLPLFGSVCASLTLSEVKLIGSADDGFYAKCAVTATGESFIKEKFTSLSGGEGLQVKSLSVEGDVGTGLTSANFEVEESFDLPFAVSEVLTHTENVCINSVQSGISCIIVDGEVNLTLVGLPFSEKSDIFNEKKNIPFRFELEHGGTLPSMRSCASAQIKKVSLTVETDDVKGVSTVNAQISLGVFGESVETATFNVCDDAYSVENLIEINRSQREIFKFCCQKTIEQKFNQTAISDIQNNGRLVTSLGEKAYLLSFNKREGGYDIDILVKANLLFKNADNGVISVVGELPVSAQINQSGEINLLSVNLCDFTAKQRGNSVDFEGVIKICYLNYTLSKIEYIEEVVDMGEKEGNDSAISVFIPRQGDGLWEISKQLGLAQEEILNLNPELSFPLSGEERIVIYRQKR